MNRLDDLRNLMFGTIALSERLVEAEALTDAIRELAADPSGSLGSILERRGLITAAQRHSIEAQAAVRLANSEPGTITATDAGDGSFGNTEATLALSPEGYQIEPRTFAPAQAAGPAVAGDSSTIAASPAKSPPGIADSKSALDGDSLVAHIGGTVPDGFERTVAVKTTASSATAEPAAAGGQVRELQIHPGAKIGRFRLLQQLSSGGMGVVIEAVDEDEIGRRVVVKMVNEQMFRDSSTLRQMRSRLRREGEINGNLEHPNIIPVYGLGSTDEGRPFYAMRYVDQIDLHEAISNFHRGKPLLRPMRTPESRETSTVAGTEEAAIETAVMPDTLDTGPEAAAPKASGNAISEDIRFDRLESDANLAFRDLLDRFARVCDAVEYAHSRNVIHRDLKPRNVMLGNHGETMVIDWGLARSIRRNAADDPADDPFNPDDIQEFDVDAENFVTVQGEVKGTLGYMPPEQLLGDLDRLDASTDIFSLGVMLFEILTGRNPYLTNDLAHMSRSERIATMIERVSSPPPDAQAINPSIPRALSAICRRAMDPQPESRYPSAGAISAEISRWLADEPVTAYSESARERSLRWARKHRPAVAAMASTLLLSMLGVAIFAAIQTRYATDLKQRNDAVMQASAQATLERNKAIENADVARKRERLAIDAVDQFASAVTKESELKNRRELAPLRKKLLEEPIRFYQTLKSTGDSGDLTDDQARLAMAQSAERLSNLNEEIGDRAKALETYLESHAIYAEIAERQPGDDAAQRNLAKSFEKLGSLYRTMGDRKNAQASLDEGLKLFRQIAADPKTAKPADAKFIAMLLNSLGGLDFESGKRDSGGKKFKESMAVLEAAVERDPESLDYLAMLSSVRNNLGVMAYMAGNLPEATEFLNKANETRQAILKKNPDSNDVRFDLAGTQMNLGQIWTQMGQYRKATEATEKAIDMLKALSDRYPAVTKYDDHIAKCYNNLCSSFMSQGNVKDAIVSAERCISIREALAASNPKVLSFRGDLCNGLMNLASILTRTKDFDKALKTYDRSFEVASELYAIDPERPEFLMHMANVSYNLGRLHDKLNHRKETFELYADAAKYFRKSVELSPDNFEAKSSLGMALYALAFAQEQQNQPDKAYESLKEGQGLIESILGGSTIAGATLEVLGYIHLTRADLNLHQKRFDDAVKDFEKAGEILRRMSAEAPDRTDYKNDVARCDLSIAYALAIVPGRPAESYERALRLAEGVRKIEPPSAITMTIESLCRYRLGRFEEALANLDQAASVPLPPDEPDAPDQKALRALVLLAQGKTEDALAAIDASKKLYPDDRKSVDHSVLAIRAEANAKLAAITAGKPK